MDNVDKMRDVADRMREARRVGMRLAARQGDLRTIAEDLDPALALSLRQDSDLVIDLMLARNLVRRDCSLDQDRFAWYRGRVYRFCYWSPTSGSFMLKPFVKPSTFWASPAETTVMEYRPGPDEDCDPVTGQSPRDFDEHLATVARDRFMEAIYKGRRYRVLAVSPRGPVHLQFLDGTGHFWARGTLVTDYRESRRPTHSLATTDSSR
jgi:hypothetical protein